jgi:hypothetical protein
VRAYFQIPDEFIGIVIGCITVRAALLGSDGKDKQCKAGMQFCSFACVLWWSPWAGMTIVGALDALLPGGERASTVIALQNIVIGNCAIKSSNGVMASHKLQSLEHLLTQVQTRSGAEYCYVSPEHLTSIPGASQARTPTARRGSLTVRGRWGRWDPGRVRLTLHVRSAVELNSSLIAPSLITSPQPSHTRVSIPHQ